MPKFLIQVSYTAEGNRGVLKEGGSARRASIQETMQALGAKIETFYFSTGDYDVVLVADVPDNATLAAMALAVGATGAATTKTTALLTPEDVDAAAKKTVQYRPPGR